MNPSQFAAVATVVVAVLAIQSLDQLGVSRAIVAWTGELGEIAPTVTTISLIFGGALFAGCYAAAPAFVGIMGVPGVVSVVRLAALRAIISSVGATPAALLQRRSPRIAKVVVDQAGNWTAVALTIALALTGHGSLSLALGVVAGSFVSASLSVIFARQALHVGFRLRAAAVAVRAGLPFAGSAVLLLLACNSDLVLVGHLLPRPDLGFYLLAVCAAGLPVALSSLPIGTIAQTVFAQFRRGPRVMDSAFLAAANLLGCLTIPTCLLIGGSASYLIQLIYGPAWAPVAPLLRWVAPLAALRIFYELTVDYLAARTSPRMTLSFQLVLVAVLVPSMIAGARWDGLIGLAVAQMTVVVVLLAPLYLWQLVQSWVRARSLVRRLSTRLAVLVVAGWVVFSIRRSMVPDKWLDLGAATFVTATVMGLLTYRMRSVLNALNRAAARAQQMGAAIPAAALPPAAAAAPPLYPVLTPVPRSPQPVQVSDTAEPGGEAGLGEKVRSATRWSFLNTAVLRIANFGVGVVLARTAFGPKAFGLYAVSQVILAVLLSANELGVSLAIVRWQEDVRSFARTVYSLSVASSALFYAGLLVGAPYAARLLGSPHATGMIRVLSLCVVIDGLACVPLALLNRTFAQRRLMLVNSVNFAVGTGVTLGLAFAGMGPISFAWGSVSGCTAALVVATLAAPFVVLPGWNTGQARKLLRFGIPLAGASLLMLGVFNVDSAIVGGTLGPAALGLYGLAFNISSWPTRSITEAVGRVAFAGFSRVAHSAELLAAAYAKTLGLLMACTVPACVMLGTLAEPIVRLVYGERWIAAVPVLTLLAILGLLRVAYDFSYDCLAAAGKRTTLLGVQAWWLAALIPVLLIGARTRGIVGVGEGHVLVAGPLVLPAFVWALSRCGIRPRSIAGACWRPFLGGIVMAVACELVLRVIGDSLLGLVAAAAAGLAVYLPLVYPMLSLLRRQEQSPVSLGEASATRRWNISASSMTSGTRES